MPRVRGNGYNPPAKRRKREEKMANRQYGSKTSLAGWVGLLIFGPAALAGQDFNCMQSCFSQGYDRSYCVGMCSTGPGAGGLMEQPGLPRNPAFDQVQPKAPRQPLPKIADPKCMKDCQQRGYSYTYCFRKACSYAPLGE